MYFYVLVKWGGVCWGLGGVWVIGRAMVFFFCGGGEGCFAQIIDLFDFFDLFDLKSKSKNRPKNPFSTPVIIL